uniref:Btz domain-containing protein n=1 Tax=Tetraselmis sp. GSL018 TaxID=582737 RepID=A0A061QS46_9CHLO
MEATGQEQVASGSAALTEDEKLRLEKSRSPSRRPRLYQRQVQEDDYVVPTSGYFFEHDDRGADHLRGRGRGRGRARGRFRPADGRDLPPEQSRRRDGESLPERGSDRGGLLNGRLEHRLREPFREEEPIRNELRGPDLQRDRLGEGFTHRDRHQETRDRLWRDGRLQERPSNRRPDERSRDRRDRDTDRREPAKRAHLREWDIGKLGARQDRDAARRAASAESGELAEELELGEWRARRQRLPGANGAEAKPRALPVDRRARDEGPGRDEPEPPRRRRFTEETNAEQQRRFGERYQRQPRDRSRSPPPRGRAEQGRFHADHGHDRRFGHGDGAGPPPFRGRAPPPGRGGGRGRAWVGEADRLSQRRSRPGPSPADGVWRHDLFEEINGAPDGEKAEGKD